MQHDRDVRALPARGDDRLARAVLEQQPVRQARQVVVHREALVLVRAARELLTVATDAAPMLRTMIRNRTAHSSTRPAASTAYSRIEFARISAAIGAHGT